MRGPHNIIRLIRTGATFERTGAMREMMDAFDVPRHLRILLRGLVWPFQWLGYRGDVTAPPLPRALTALGPAYIKFGQVLSTRPDVVGPDLAQQLRVLQDKLPAFATQEAKAEIARELELDPDTIFDDFSDAVAAASIAQVHRATLKETGETVAVKVLRPNIERAFKKDIDAFYFAASVIQTLSPASRRLRPVDVIEHFESIVAGELDLRLESAAASEFQANTQNDEGFGLPTICWNLSARRVMTMGWIDGTSAADVEELRAQGHDLPKIGARVLQLFLNHALRDGYFHGDMHQGNLKIAPNGDILAYDFGIMGHIDEYTRRVYAEILFGFIRRDFRRVAEVHFEAGYVPADQDVEAFARALRAVGEPIFGMDANQISMGRLLSYLFEVTERFGMETRTELILLQRTMVVVEGVARSLDPKINIWEVAQPIVESYIQQSIGPKAFARDMAKTLRVIGRFGPRLPQMVERLIEQQNQLSEAPKSSGWVSALAFTGLGFCAGLIVWAVSSL